MNITNAINLKTESKSLSKGSKGTSHARYFLFIVAHWEPNPRLTGPVGAPFCDPGAPFNAPFGAPLNKEQIEIFNIGYNGLS